MFRFAIESVKGKTQVHDLALGRYTLGRGLGCDIRLPGKLVGRRHAVLTLAPDDVSLNGVQENRLQYRGESLDRLEDLTTGTEVGLGEARLIVLANPYRHAPQASVTPVSGETCLASISTPNPINDPRGSASYVAEKRTLQLAIYQELDLFKRAVIKDLDAESLRTEALAAAHKITAVQAFHLPDGISTEAFITEVVAESIGLGPVESLLADPDVTEIMINGPDAIYVERQGCIQRTDQRFTSEDSLRGVIERIVAPLGRRIDEGSPMVDARLSDGSRVNAIIPPLSLTGPVLTIRKFAKHKFDLQALVAAGSMSESMAAFLQQCVQHRKNIVVSGGTGSGKTTLLNALSDHIPVAERIITIEDAAELKLSQEHVVSLEARPANVEGRGAVPIRELVRNALRMRPDRIVVGECRGGEALDMLQAMNTGHEGSLTTAHANSPRELLSRLEVMVLMAGMDLPVRVVREQIAGSVDIIVQQARFRDGRRRITSIVEVGGMERDVILLHNLFAFHQTRVDENGQVHGFYTGLGMAPGFYDEMERGGHQVDRNLFVRHPDLLDRM